MARIKKKRLLNAAKATREMENFHDFSMGAYGKQTDHPCGSPMCVLGNYAHRRDLQDAFSLGKDGSLRKRGGRKGLWFADPYVLNHFGITTEQAYELFSTYGCGDARFAGQAADYIENFVRCDGKLVPGVKPKAITS